MAAALARKTGSNSTWARMRRVPVLAIHPATPEPANAKYARQRSLPPVSAAKVTKEFITYEPLMAMIQAIVFAAIKENIVALPHLQSADSEAKAASVAAELSKTA